MRIKSISIKNFKRFTDLSITNIDESVKTIIVVGPNGCGKSSLFEAIYSWYRKRTRKGLRGNDSYYWKTKKNMNWSNIQLDFHDLNQTSQNYNKNMMCFRTAYRNTPNFNTNEIKRLQNDSEITRFNTFIDTDENAVAHNYNRLLLQTMGSVFDTNNDGKTVKALREELIGKIQRSMHNVFCDLELNHLQDITEESTFFFKKGNVSSFHYKNLSSGEKSAFDLLLHIIMNQELYNNSVYCIDEIETHMHTELQGKLFKEIFNLIPGNSQLWISTHSFGVLKAAKELLEDYSGEIAVIDFSSYDFDEECTISPTTVSQAMWEKYLELTLGDFSRFVTYETIFVCEGTHSGYIRNNFDAKILNNIFSQAHPGVLFVCGGNCIDLRKPNCMSVSLLKAVLPNSRIIKLIDRDDMSQEEVREFSADGNKVLSLRHIEAYLFADEIIEKLVSKHYTESDTQGKKDKLLAMKKNRIKQSVGRDNAPDDIKSAAGDIYNDLKRELKLTQHGSNSDAFMVQTLAPLVTPDTAIYRVLERDIFDS